MILLHCLRDSVTSTIPAGQSRSLLFLAGALSPTFFYQQAPGHLKLVFLVHSIFFNLGIHHTVTVSPIFVLAFFLFHEPNPPDPL